MIYIRVFLGQKKQNVLPVVADDMLAEDCRSPRTAFEVHINVGLSVVVEVTMAVGVLL